MKLSRTLAALALLPAAWSANAALSSAGDLMFTSFNSQEDGFSLVALADIAANTTVYFTDNEWNGSAIGSGGAFNTGESYSQWVSGASSIAAGTVIRFNNVDSATLLGASVGTFSRVSVSGSSNWGISTTADSVYAYLGTAADAPTVFLSAVTNGSGGFTSATNGYLTGTGLTAGTTAVQLASGALFAEYTGSRTGQASFTGYEPLVGSAANWNTLTTGTNATAIPNTTAFAISQVPESDALLLSLAGLGAMGLIRRRSV